MKKFNLSLSACVLIVLSMLLVGCVPQAPGTAETSGAVELELMIAPEGVFGDITPETYSMQLLADRTGFSYAFRQIPREFLGERIATTLASGDLPDIMQLGLPADATGDADGHCARVRSARAVRIAHPLHRGRRHAQSRGRNGKTARYGAVDDFAPTATYTPCLRSGAYASCGRGCNCGRT